jgi:transposase
MPTLPLGSRVFVSTQPADMRKSFDGLIALTKTALQRNPLSGDLYVYVNRSATMVKVLYWTRGGFCV